MQTQTHFTTELSNSALKHSQASAHKPELHPTGWYSKHSPNEPESHLLLQTYKQIMIWYNTCLTYLLTPWCRVLLEKLTVLQLVKKFPTFYGNCKFITALTSVRQLSLSWVSPIQSTYPHPTPWRSILISTHLRLGLPSGLFPSSFATKTLYAPSPHSYAPHAQPIYLLIKQGDVLTTLVTQRSWFLGAGFHRFVCPRCFHVPQALRTANYASWCELAHLEPLARNDNSAG